jgi:hypothetical protein
MVDELPGESMPDGIEVDDAAAYFGITESSDMVHTLMAMDRLEAMEKFFEVLSDIVLLPGEFDFNAASERIQCEGGEIYYLVAGHLGIMTMPDSLSHYLGTPDSAGDSSGNTPSLSEEELAKLTTLADPMKLLKLLAVAYATGGKGEVTRYLTTVESFLAQPEANKASLLTVAEELEAALDVAGHALPVPTLASGVAASASVPMAPTPSAPAPAPVPKPAVNEPSIPLPTASKPVPLPTAVTPESPTAKVELPPMVNEPVVEPTVDTTNEKQVAKATQDAFAGAFDIGLKEETTEVPAPPPAPEPVSVELPEPMVPDASVPVQEVLPEPVQEPATPEPAVSPLEMPVTEEELFTSAAEHFIAADTDGSEQLSVEELAVATGTTLEEATVLHAEADTDGDGSVSLSEFMSSPAAGKAAGLPRPVAPVRKPLTQPVQQQQEPQQPPQQPQQQSQQQQQGWNQQQQQQGWNQQHQQQQAWNQQQQQQGWNQQQPTHQWNQAHPTMPSVQPTIRSGVMCRGCGIGLDPYWRFCPICGTQNAVQ